MISMEFFKKNMEGSPYLGIFSSLSDQFLLLPHGQSHEFTRMASRLHVHRVETTLAASTLIGIYAKTLGDKTLISYLAQPHEIKHLQSEGLNVKTIESLALGNLIALNDSGGIASKTLSATQVKQISEFFEVPFIQSDIAQSPLVGSALCVSNKGFIVHPQVSEKELALLEKTFQVRGSPATANYGDRFVANSVIANQYGVITGELTTGFELARIDEGLGGR
ncbi:MAG: translation initiation factor IF-6 [Candidatus Diapherotrites archaeon]|nr:translation initiation factor IF-6 [Candidatus Diapherotrites archaeon]